MNTITSPKNQEQLFTKESASSGGNAAIGGHQSSKQQTTTAADSPTRPGAPTRPHKAIEKLNKAAAGSLPPGVEGNPQGSLFVEVGDLEWFTYDQIHYLQDSGADYKPVEYLFANIKFWGESSKGIYLRMQNSMKKGEKVSNKYKYQLKCPERTFERYLDDMGVLIVDFFDTRLNQTIGTSKIMMKLYVKRAKREDDEAPLLELRGSFPITLTGNQKIKIGQFSISLVSSYPVAHRGVHPSTGLPIFNLEKEDKMNDSFEANEKKAQELTFNEKNAKIHDKIFQDDRVPYSLERGGKDYKPNYFGDEEPTRERAQRPMPSQVKQNPNQMGKENQPRNRINIDERDDTFHNQDELAKILARGERLRNQMDQALDSGDAWESLHGKHNVPKKYVPPFLAGGKEEAKISNSEEIDRLYELEIERKFMKKQGKNGRPLLDTSDDEKGQNEDEVSGPQNSGHVSEMKFIKVKINSLRIENEEMLHQLIDQTFSIIIDVPLPDVYQKKIAFQTLKLNNYDVVSFNEFAFNNSTLYYFKVDEETFNKLVQSNLKVQLDGYSVSGQLGMIKLLMAKGYKYQASIALEKTIKVGEEQVSSVATTPAASAGGKKDVKKKPQGKSVDQKKPAASQQSTIPSGMKRGDIYTQRIGTINIELSLQRGETDEEIAREYQLKLLKLQEERDVKEEEKVTKTNEYRPYTMQQEPQFAQLYINIKQVRNICLKLDGTIIPIEVQENQLQPEKQVVIIEGQAQIVEVPQQNFNPQILVPKRNLYIQYKSFPSKEVLKTNVVFQESDPRFQYRSQFPIIVNPDTIQKLFSYTFILEVWDTQQASKEELLGIVKIPLSSFSTTMKTTDTQIFSLNFLADQHCLYPMMISDGFLPIYSPRLGQNIGELDVTLALGTALQINRQIQKEQEYERQQQQIMMQTMMVDLMRETAAAQAAAQAQAQAAAVAAQAQASMNFPQPIPEPETPPKKEEEEQKLPLGNDLLIKSLGNFFKQSVNSTSRDVDIRKQTYINCLRKMFEDARASDIKDLSGKSEVFKELPKNYDGTIKKDDFIYAILNTKIFTLTRTEISNISALLLTNASATGAAAISIDLEELQRSYRSYLTYYDSIEGRIKDLLEKFMVSTQKKIEDNTQYEQFVKQIEDASQESKIPLQELRDIFDNNGIFIRDALYDQLASYFDLDRNDKIYITSFCEYLIHPRLTNFNFFKVHPVIVVNLVSEYIKNEVQLKEETLSSFEADLKSAIQAQRGIGLPEGVDLTLPEDVLVQEKISATQFHQMMKKYGVQLSFWEVFTLFDHLNTTYQKLYYEPQRYHQMTFPPFYRFITNEDYEAKMREDALKRYHRQREEELKRQFEADQERLIKEQQEKIMRASMDSAMDLAADLNSHNRSRSKKKGTRKSHSNNHQNNNNSYVNHNDPDDDGGIYSDEKKKVEKVVDDEKEEEIVTIQEPRKKRPVKVMTETYDSESDNESSEKDENDGKDIRPFRKAKHTFEIQVKELKNIPILDKLIKDIQAVDKAKSGLGQKSSKSKYIQNVAVKYSFPLDEDELFQSDFIQLNSEVLEESHQYDYKVSINTVHNYVLNRDDPIQKLLSAQSSTTSGGASMFNISLVIYDNHKEYVIGNSQLPIEDLVDMVDHYNSQITNNVLPEKKESLSRILFIYGTTYSQRENCIIGKLQLEINYQIEKQEVIEIVQNKKKPGKNSGEYEITPQAKEEDLTQDTNPACFLHRETFIKRKIPLNAILSVEIERINNMKESIENIEHFAKIQTQVMNDGSSTSLNKLNGRDQNDRRRILTQIFKQGLNIVVIASVFDEDRELYRKFPMSKYTSRILYNTLTPIFNEGFEIGIQMDTNIFEYLKNKKAIFEVRHYIVDSRKYAQSYNAGTESDQKSQASSSAEEHDEKDIMSGCDYIVLGYVRVPLLHLITKNNGIDGDFVIFDEYKQQMGSLKIRIALNHHSSKRPLYSETSKIPAVLNQDVRASTMIDKSVVFTQSLLRNNKEVQGMSNQFLLGLNFVELLFKNKEAQLFTQNVQSFMYLKFNFLGQTYQTKFISNQSALNNSQYLKQLQLSVLDIKKTVFIEVDLLRQADMEEAFSKPLEVTLWLKREHPTLRYHSPELEVILGSFFIELNELGKMKNRRVKDQNGLIQAHEGYFSLYDFKTQQVSADRLGCKIMMIKKEYDTQLADLEVLFHNLDGIDQGLIQQLDKECRGHVEVDELIELAQAKLQDPYLSMLKSYISEGLEYKSSNKVYYSPLVGSLPPFFKYVHRFETYNVIEKFNKELQSIDVNGSGYVPVNLFRSILEHELKIKEKIVVDFIHNLREIDSANQVQSLDVNLFTHSLKNHIDYATFLRKLANYFEIRESSIQIVDSMSANIPGLSSHDEEVILRIDIESALRLRNPISDLESPNTFVSLNLPYHGSSPSKLVTGVVAKSSYPAWHFINQSVRFNLTNEALRQIIELPLEFEVYHQQLIRGQYQNVLIGVAFVDLSQMVFIDGVYQIGGHFHVLKKDQFKNHISVSLTDPHRLTMDSLGQVKIGITTSTNLRRTASVNPITRTMIRENSPIQKVRPDEIINYNPLVDQSQRLSQVIFAPYRENSGYNSIQQSQTKIQLERNLQKVGLELQERPAADLKMTLQDQMSALDQMTRKLRENGLVSSPVLSEGVRRSNYQANINNGPQERQGFGNYDPYQSSFAVTIGHSHSQDLRSSFQPFAYRQDHRGIGLQGLNAITESSEREPGEGLSSGISAQKNFHHNVQNLGISGDYNAVLQNMVEEPEENKLEDSFKRDQPRNQVPRPEEEYQEPNVFENNISQNSSHYEPQVSHPDEDPHQQLLEEGTGTFAPKDAQQVLLGGTFNAGKQVMMSGDDEEEEEEDQGELAKIERVLKGLK